jgi:hypothetical protein
VRQAERHRASSRVGGASAVKTHASLMLFQKFSGSVTWAWHACRQSAADTRNACGIALCTTLDMLIVLALAPSENCRPKPPAVDGLLAPADVDPDMSDAASGLFEVESSTWNSRLGTSGKREAMAMACERKMT